MEFSTFKELRSYLTESTLKEVTVSTTEAGFDLIVQERQKYPDSYQEFMKDYKDLSRMILVHDKKLENQYEVKYIINE